MWGELASVFKACRHQVFCVNCHVRTVRYVGVTCWVWLLLLNIHQYTANPPTIHQYTTLLVCYTIHMYTQLDVGMHTKRGRKREGEEEGRGRICNIFIQCHEEYPMVKLKVQCTLWSNSKYSAPCDQTQVCDHL